MAFNVSVTANCDDVFLAWDTGADIPGCLGFAIERDGTIVALPGPSLERLKRVAGGAPGP